MQIKNYFQLLEKSKELEGFFDCQNNDFDKQEHLGIIIMHLQKMQNDLQEYFNPNKIRNV